MDVKILNVKDIQNCPMCIFLPSHYRANGTCRCDEAFCEEESCEHLKYKKEIYCKRHCKRNYGEEYG